MLCVKEIILWSVVENEKWWVCRVRFLRITLETLILQLIREVLLIIQTVKLIFLRCFERENILRISFMMLYVVYRLTQGLCLNGLI